MQELDDGLEQLDLLLEDAKGPLLGAYALRSYRSLSLRVKGQVEAGRFEDASRVERLFSVLSSRYVHVLSAHRAGNGLPLCWDVALAYSGQDNGTVLQQLLLSTNALLNLELGVSAATAMRGQRFEGLAADFERLRRMLLEQLELANSGLARVAPALKWIGFGMGKPKQWLVSQCAQQFQESAWDFGRRLSELDPAFWPAAIADRDSLTSELAWKIAAPSIPARIALYCLHLLERPPALGEVGPTSR
jgi:hypothetical protein